MASMELRELSVISILLFTLLSCGSSDKERMKYYNLDDIHLENKNGIILLNNQPFSGVVYSMFSNTKDTAEIVTFYKGKEHGEWKKFYPNGRLAGRRFFENGTKVKTLKEWWENGNIKISGSFSEGENNGEYREWNRNGRLVRDMHYKLGYEEGSQKQFYDNGKIRSNYFVKQSKRYGLLGTKNCVNVTERIFKK